MNSLPQIVVDHHSCLLIGAGAPAETLAWRLEQAGARVRRVETLAGHELNDADLLALAGDGDAQRTAAQIATGRGLPVYAPDNPLLGTVELRQAIPIAGAGLSVPLSLPAVLVEDLTQRLVAAVPLGYERLVEWVRERQGTLEGLPAAEQWRIWQAVREQGALEAVLGGQGARAAQLLGEARKPSAGHGGEVYLIGAGPGDPDLLTVRALRLLRHAEVVLYDRLVAPSIVELCPAGAERIYVGKRRARHAVPQESINDMLVRLAAEGRRVARLKGGDPFIFGRGGEEIESLMAEGIPFQVVPGITAANGCAAYAGIPLTHRDHAQSCLFVTGHRRGERLDLDYEALVRPAQTVVIYMGLHNLPELCRELIAHGLPADMPGALIQQGTTQNQVVVSGAVPELPALAERHELRAPCLVVIGTVVKLREKLAWFRAEGGGGPFWDGPAAARLEDRGE